MPRHKEAEVVEEEVVAEQGWEHSGEVALAVALESVASVEAVVALEWLHSGVVAAAVLVLHARVPQYFEAVASVEGAHLCSPDSPAEASARQLSDPWPSGVAATSSGLLADSFVRALLAPSLSGEPRYATAG